MSGHAPDAAQFMSIATETFIKEVLASVFSRTRSNGPGEFGSSGFGGNNWVQTRKYRRQLAREEERSLRGEIHRDKVGLLPIEAKKAGEREPLGVADFRIALEMGDCGLTQFPIVGHSLLASYREGELEGWDDYTFIDSYGPDRDALLLEAPQPTSGVNGAASGAATVAAGGSDAAGTAVAAAAGVTGTGVGSIAMVKTASTASAAGAAAAVSLVASDALLHPPGLPNGVDHSDLMDIDEEEMLWEGADIGNTDILGSVLESCLTVG